MKSINTYFWISLAAITISNLPLTVLGASFDGSQTMICAPQLVIECGPGGKCEQAMAASVNLPNFFQIDVSAMEITTLTESDNKRTSTIKTKEFLDDKLFLQGADDGIEGVRDGLAWSISITQDTGRLVLSAAGGNEAFVIFGACTPR
jgi:hypothetical protein